MYVSKWFVQVDERGGHTFVAKKVVDKLIQALKK